MNVCRSRIAIAVVSISAIAVLAGPGRAAPPDPALREGDRIVALGDSITQAGGYLDLLRKVLARFHPELGIEVVNAGISGHKSPDMRERLERDVLSKKPTIVTVSCGINDVWHGFYNPPRGVDLETYSRLMAEIADRIAAAGARVYLLTPTVIHEDLRSAENRKLEAYCEAVRRIAAEKGCRLVDLNDDFNLALEAARLAGADFHPTSDGVHMRPAGDFIMGAAILRALGVPMREILEVVRPEATAAVCADDPRLELWGRWDLRDSLAGAVTVNTGSTIIARFEGTGLTLHFAMAHYPRELPTLWLQVDDGEWRVVPVAADVAASAEALGAGAHTVRAVVKGLREWDERWKEPIASKVVFRGVTPAAGARLIDAPPRPARIVEYLGDSITEGVLVLYDRSTGPWRQELWPQYSDGRRGWAYQSAILAGVEPRTVGFGRLGLTVGGNGGVPVAAESFGWIRAGAPIDHLRPADAVVVNLGTNDGGASAETFKPLYRAYVETIRKRYPEARIFCLRPFNGAQAGPIEEAVKALVEGGDRRLRTVDTTGWIDPARHTTDGVHLSLEGNRVAAEKVAAILRDPATW